MAVFFESGKVLYEGLVLETRERNYHDDSDFYAVVWDAATGRPVEVEYATTRFAGGGGATVDATPEVRAAYEAYYVERRAAAAKEKAEREARTPAAGKTVKVVRGRKVPKGTVGRCFWVGEGRWGVRLGMETADGVTHWTAAKNVEVVL